ncbi:Mizu-kussei [Thalictrum thalictroides]|uniref:Mizu-kussei n=1 Tax=Thalictrum thalictroides TaxID=46969 RepID=A0A7J6WT65_THATH|nr:Mizu-kussei [Thalictrum thalictroides]
MSYTTGSATHTAEGVTTVDCQKQVRSWSLLRSLIEFLIPTCTCYYLDQQEIAKDRRYINNNYRYRHSALISATITGTIFGYRRGKANICIQSTTNNTIPLLLLELPVPTAILAKEMKSGILRIALECKYDQQQSSSSTTSLLSEPVWNMYCNGKIVGCAVKRRPTQANMDFFRLMCSVHVGTGVINRKTLNCDNDLMYLRANFERVSRSTNSESFHLISPDGSTGQELSIFFLRTG